MANNQLKEMEMNMKRTFEDYLTPTDELDENANLQLKQITSDWDDLESSFGDLTDVMDISVVEPEIKSVKSDMKAIIAKLKKARSKKKK